MPRPGARPGLDSVWDIWLNIGMLYFIFTVDGDWKEYFDVNLSEEERAPKKDILQDLIQREIELARQLLDGRFIHFIHTSPRARDFFLGAPFLKLWEEIVKNGGDIGLHCHEDDPYKSYYCQDNCRMRDVISDRINAFRKAGLNIKSYRGGFLGFSDETTRILEENEILFDFSCEPGRCLTHGETLICDWRSAPMSLYRMSYDNHCKEGDSRVWEIPLGSSGGRYLYFEKAFLKDIEKIAFALKNRSIENKCDIIVSALSHTYEYVSRKAMKGIEEKLALLKKYGSFINLRELEKIINRMERREGNFKFFL